MQVEDYGFVKIEIGDFPHVVLDLDVMAVVTTVLAYLAQKKSSNFWRFLTKQKKQTIVEKEFSKVNNFTRDMESIMSEVHRKT